MSALKNELGDFRQNSHEFFGEQRKVSGIAYLPLTFRLPYRLPCRLPCLYRKPYKPLCFAWTIQRSSSKSRPSWAFLRVFIILFIEIIFGHF